MLSQPCLHEMQTNWLPNITDQGLDRLISLLEKDSPLLIHGSFTQAMPQGCLATHVAWNHPETEHLCNDAGIVWLSRVARVNPSFSRVVQEWDTCREANFEVRTDLLELLKKERQDREDRVRQPACPQDPQPCGV